MSDTARQGQGPCEALDSGPALSVGELEMLATDLAEVLSREEYGIDVSANDVVAALPAFLNEALRHAAAAASEGEWEEDGDAARWAPGDAAETPTLQSGRAPRMYHTPWLRSQGVDLGEAHRGEHYWRCPKPGCRTWAGPYRDILTAKEAGMDHRADAHDGPAAIRDEARRAARRLGGRGMDARAFDAMVARQAAEHAVPAGAVHYVVSRIDGVVRGYSAADYLVGGIVRNGIVGGGEEAVKALVLAVADDLGRRDWFVRMGV